MDEVDRLLPTALYPRPEPSDEFVTIGSFARRSRLSMKALRLYERHELLVPARVDDRTGYRYYREQQLGTARLIAQLRRLDMPLVDVAAVVAESGERRAEMLKSYWDEVERRLASQRELAAHLQMRLSGADPVSAEIRERDQPELLVITERRRIGVDELAEWLGRTMSRLACTAGEFGGMVAPQFVVYYGEVNQDSDGPVEICTPIARDTDIAGAIPIRGNQPIARFICGSAKRRSGIRRYCPRSTRSRHGSPATGCVAAPHRAKSISPIFRRRPQRTRSATSHFRFSVASGRSLLTLLRR